MNRDLIAQFQTLQNFYKKEGDKGRSIAYGKAIIVLRTINEPITNISQIKGIRGIGPKVIDKVREFLNSGKVRVAEEKKIILEKPKILSKEERVIEQFQTIWGIGPKKAQKLYDDGITSLKKLIKNKNLLTPQQQIGLKYREQLLQKIPENYISSLLVVMKYFLNEKYGKDSYKIEIAGSYRRLQKESGDIDCLITSKVFTLQEVVKFLREKNIITEILSMRTEKFMGIVKCPNDTRVVRLDIEFVKKSEWGSALLYFTGSKGFNVYMRAEAKRQGLLLNEHGLFDLVNHNLVLKSPSEQDIFERLKIRYTDPENR